MRGDVLVRCGGRAGRRAGRNAGTAPRPDPYIIGKSGQSAIGTLQSLTWDQGSGMGLHHEFWIATDSLNAPPITRGATASGPPSVPSVWNPAQTRHP
jgi:hypothetical protein